MSALAKRQSRLAQYHLVLDGEPGSRVPWTLHTADESGRAVAHFATKAAAMRDLRQRLPHAVLVGAHWFAPVALAKPAEPADDLAVVTEAPLVSMCVGLRFTDGTTTIYTATHHDGTWWHFAGNDGDVLRYTEEDCRRHFALGMWTVAKPAASLEEPAVDLYDGMRFVSRTGVGDVPITLRYGASERIWNVHNDKGDFLAWWTTDQCHLFIATLQWVPERPATDPLIAVRDSGRVWGQVDATNHRPDDSHRAYCRAWPAEAQDQNAPAGHCAAFRDSYDDAYGTECARQRADVSRRRRLSGGGQ